MGKFDCMKISPFVVLFYKLRSLSEKPEIDFWTQQSTYLQ